jgi:hypothetical protein
VLKGVKKFNVKEEMRKDLRTFKRKGKKFLLVSDYLCLRAGFLTNTQHVNEKELPQPIELNDKNDFISPDGKRFCTL